MTRKEIKAVIEPVLTWPEEQQQATAELLLVLEAREGQVYEPSEEEWAAILEGAAQVDRGETVSQEELDALWRRLGV